MKKQCRAAFAASGSVALCKELRSADSRQNWPLVEGHRIPLSAEQNSLKAFLPGCHAGEMAEWLKAHAWKACLLERVTWVRIPLSPPEFQNHSQNAGSAIRYRADRNTDIMIRVRFGHGLLRRSAALCRDSYFRGIRKVGWDHKISLARSPESRESFVCCLVNVALRRPKTFRFDRDVRDRAS